MNASLETKRAMFWAALAAQCADEPYVTRNRMVVALLRTDAVNELCQRLQIEPSAVIFAIEDPQALSFDECERRVMSDLAEKGLQLASKEHQATVSLRPADPAVKGVINAILEEHGHLAIAPVPLLLELTRADAALAKRLADHRLTAEALENG